MLADLLPLLALTGAAVAIWILRERHRRRTAILPPAPEITMAQAWEMWQAGLRDHPDRVFTRGDAAGAPGAFEALAEIERRTQASDYPRMTVRKAILELATMGLHLDAIAALGERERELLLKGYTAGMEALLDDTTRACRVEWLVLRWYARMKYDDAVPDDWFHHYLLVAGPYVREKVRLARDYLVEVDEGAGRFAEIYDKLLDELRREVLAVRPKRRFPPADLV